MTDVFNKKGFQEQSGGGASTNILISPKHGMEPITLVLYGEKPLIDRWVYDGTSSRLDPKGVVKFWCNAFDLSDGKLKVLNGSYSLFCHIRDYAESVGTALILHQPKKGKYTVTHRPLTDGETKAATAAGTQLWKIDPAKPWTTGATREDAGELSPGEDAVPF